MNLRYLIKMNFIMKIKILRIIFYKFLNFKKFENFLDLELNSSSVVLDLGANIGEISQFIKDIYDCNIYCFEPNNHAFKVLKKRFNNEKKIFLFNKAVGVKDDKTCLYYHQLSDKNPIMYSTGSSLVKKKTNVNENNYQETETLSIVNLLDQFENIDLIKIDIEGYEYEILNYVFQNKKKIKKVICELHGDPRKQKNNFLNDKYLETIKILKEIDPEKKWFIYHH